MTDRSKFDLSIVELINRSPCNPEKPCPIFELEKETYGNILVYNCINKKVIKISANHAEAQLHRIRNNTEFCEYSYVNPLIYNFELGSNSAEASDEEKIAFFLSVLILKPLEEQLDSKEKLILFLSYKNYAYRLALCFLNSKDRIKTRLNYITSIETEIIYQEYELIQNLFELIIAKWKNIKNLNLKSDGYKLNLPINLLFKIIQNYFEEKYKEEIDIIKLNNNRQLECEDIIYFRDLEDILIEKFKENYFKNIDSDKILEKYIAKNKKIVLQKNKYIKSSERNKQFSIEPKIFGDKPYIKFPQNEITSAINDTVYKAGTSGNNFWQSNSGNFRGGRNFSFGRVELLINNKSNANSFAEVTYKSKEVIVKQFGEQTLKLHYTLAAIAFSKPKALNKKITVSASKLLATFGENKQNKQWIPKKLRESKLKASCYLAKEEKLRKLAHHIYLLKQLEVWIKEYQEHNTFSVETTNLWDIFKIKQIFKNMPDDTEKLIDIEFTFSPGSWFEKFNDSQYTREFGYLSSEILKLNLNKDKIAFRLAYYAIFGSQKTENNIYSIETLIKNIDCSVEIEVAKSNANEALNLKRSFDRAIKTLAEFEHPYKFNYQSDTPEWVHLENKIRKPQQWIEHWLECRVSLSKPKFELNKKLSSTKTSPKENLHQTQQSINILSFGELIRNTRKSHKISLRTAAKDLGISAARLSQIETGSYPHPITPELKNQLLEFFDLK